MEVNNTFYVKVSGSGTGYRVLVIPPKVYSFDKLANLLNRWAVSHWSTLLVDDVIAQHPDLQWTKCLVNILPNSSFSINCDDSSAQHNCQHCHIFDVRRGVYTDFMEFMVQFYGSAAQVVILHYLPYLNRLNIKITSLLGHSICK